MNVKTSHSGGIIRTFEDGRVVHVAARGAYSGEVAETGIPLVNYDAVKRGRGRPRKDSGKKFDFSAFLTPVDLPEWTGNSTFRITPENE